MDIKGAASKGFSAIAARLASANLWIALLAIAGIAQLVVGVFILAGIGWALVAGAVVAMILAYALTVGVRSA